MNELIRAVRGADIAVYHFLTRYAGNWALARIVSHEEQNNILKGGLFFALFWCAWFRADGDRDKRRKAIFAILIGSVVAIIVARTVAFAAPFRVRPINDPGLAHPAYSVPFAANLENWSWFPSDTAAYFFALAFGLAYLFRRYAIPVMLYTAAWICLPRLYLGVHYASDVVVGSVIGVLSVWLTLHSGIVESSAADRALAAAETKPEWFYPAAFLVSFEMATVFAELRDLGRAALHLTLLMLDVRYKHSSSPLDEWGGLCVLAALFLVGAYVARSVHRKHRGIVQHRN